MKLIFIDIDGVLNSASGEGPYISDMEIDKLELLRNLIQDTDTNGIVITSDRRYSKIDIANKIEAFDSFQIHVVGVLRNPIIEDDFDNRGKQVLDYLSSFKEDIDKMVIIDDEDDGISDSFKENFIQVNRFYGLSLKNIESIKKLLN